jgi:hypothetical protein
MSHANLLNVKQKKKTTTLFLQEEHCYSDCLYFS